MKPLYAMVLTVRSDAREQIYGALLAQPARDWNIRDLAELLPDVSVEAVTATLHMLTGDQLMDIVPRQRRLTMRLNGKGRSTITEITQLWASERDVMKAAP